MTLSGVVGFQRARLVRAAARSAAMAVLLIVAYYVIPVEHHPHQSVVLRLGLALAIFIAVLANEVRSIVNHDEPMLRAGVSMATVVPLFVVLFSWIYLTMSLSDPGSFNTPLDRTRALYFTTTIFSTVGFGDIVPKVDAARVVTMVQMAADLVVVAVVVRLIFGAAKARPAEHAPGDGPGADR